MNNLFIHFTDDGHFTHVLPCVHKVVIEDTQGILDFVNQNKGVIILEVKHQQFKMRLDLAELETHELWYFNEEKTFSSRAYSLLNNKNTILINTEVPYIVLIRRDNEDIVASNLLTCFDCNSVDLSEYNPFDVIRIPMYRFPLLYIQSETGKVLRANTTYYFN
jgi:hypothetical protein